MSRLAALLGAMVLSAPLAGPAAAWASDDITAAQPELPRQKLTIVSRDGTRHVFSVELTRTPREQEVGLMYRTEIRPDGGMLFVWPQLQRAQMWMEHCPVPEDMVFIAADGRIASIAENTVPESLAVIDSGVPVKATLELQGGLTAKENINVGDRVEAAALRP